MYRHTIHRTFPATAWGPTTAPLKIVSLFRLKACVRYFYKNFIFLPNDSPSKSMKNVFYFIQKALFVLEIFKFLPFFPFLSTLSRLKRTNGSGIIYDAMNWFA